MDILKATTISLTRCHYSDCNPRLVIGDLYWSADLDSGCWIQLMYLSFRLPGIMLRTRICASLGLRMKFKTLFISNHDLLLFFNMSNQFLAPGGLTLNAEFVKVNVM